MRSPNHLLLYHRGFSFAEAFLFSPGRTGGLFPRLKTPNKAYIDGFGYVAPAKTKTIIVDSDGDINKMVGTME